ncbi:TIGR03364 family FAD-dependent oxidoreductase [Alcaligenes sp. SDU_A2]|uniref:TIGR03364 family FAD-dependent oxidoreductase n=1 Tax=Alcaligenes sp. SDU_A2 TaxID=3136634 RepID=UPI002C72778E|nr:TIGR03364 family FAD-dependent oxidoreductase [Alcaligenes sp.]HRL28188.1 TIGR03364 family FAD-dependent oxidoreductase [Alcaligenes sp.]
MTQHYDVIIVGGGILGMAHAWAAARRKLNVAVFERSHQAQGATIRNFGQVLVTGQAPGIMMELARESHPLWLALAAQAGFHVRSNGSLVLARNQLEMDVLADFAQDRAQKLGVACRLLNGRELAGLFEGRLAHHHGALQGMDDLQIYSRDALPAITASLQAMGVTVYTNAHVHIAQEGRVQSNLGNFSADSIYVCPGHDYVSLHRELLATVKPSVTRLQMLKVRAVDAGWQLDRPLLTGLSCLHYGAFSDLPLAQTLREQVQQRHGTLLDQGIHLLISPTPEGDLIIGDSHDYGQQASPFNQEETDQLMLDLAQTVLGCRVQVLQRWQGVYGAKGPAPFSVLQADPTTQVTVMHTGLGMTTGLAIGERNVAARYGDAVQ